MAPTAQLLLIEAIDVKDEIVAFNETAPSTVKRDRVFCRSLS